MKFLRPIALGIATLLALAGCGYQLGAIQIGHNKTIAIPRFINNTGQPDLEVRATNAVIDRMQVDGSYKVVADPSQADYILVGVLASYQRDAVTFDRSDVTREYRSTLSANLEFKDAKTNKVLWTASRVQGEALFPRGSDQAEQERSAYPRLVQDLAKFVVEKVVDGGW